MLTGIEATAINREPDNPWRKISMWSTFKNRPDTEYFSPPPDPANMNAQALRIESQPGTGFERGIVFAQISLHVSRNVARPVAIDFEEIDEAAVEGIDVMCFPRRLQRGLPGARHAGDEVRQMSHAKSSTAPHNKTN